MSRRNIQIITNTFESIEGKAIDESIDYESILESDFQSFWAESREKPSISQCKARGYIVLTTADLEKFNLKFLKYQPEGFVEVVWERCYLKPIKTPNGIYYGLVPIDPTEFFWSNLEKRLLSENMSDEEFFKRAQTELNHLKYIRSVPKVGETPEIIDYEVKSQIDKTKIKLIQLNKILKSYEKRKNKKFWTNHLKRIKYNIEKTEQEIKSLNKKLYIKPEEDNSLQEKTSLDDFDNFKYDRRDYFK